MSAWTALNIVPDSDSEGEIDNTEEIQIEEALKLYQRALKLHTDGEWEEANQAYEDLFRSEIFQIDAVELEEEVEAHSRGRHAASSLPLVHYLAFKNHGTFKLDRLKDRISVATPAEIQQEVGQALEWFATALGRDAGDSSLWRESAQLALILRSARLARFALESILDHRTVGADASKDALSIVSGGIPNPEEHLALVQLGQILERMNDTDSLTNPALQRCRKRKLKPSFTKFMNPYPWLPTPPPDSPTTLSREIQEFSKSRDEIQVDTRSWTAVGKALLSHIPQDDGTFDAEDAPATSGIVNVVIPAGDGDDNSRDTTPDDDNTAVKSETTVTEDNDVQMNDPAIATLIASNDRRRSGSANRKRKSTSMGVDTTGSRLSKRQRDKKEADAAAAAAAASTPESKAKVRNEAADEKLFNTVEDIFAPFNLSLGTAESLRITPASEDPDTTCTGEKNDLYVEDFKLILQKWDDEKGNVIIYGDGIQSPAEAAQTMRFLDMEANAPTKPILPNDEGLRRWVKGINNRALSAEEAGFEWLKALTRRDTNVRGVSKRARGKSSSGANHSIWTRYSWPDGLKNAVTDIADISEDILLQHFKNVQSDIAVRMEIDGIQVFSDDDYADIEWAETILEIYLDDLATAERVQGDGDVTVDVEHEIEVKKERATRWGRLVGDLMNCRPRDSNGIVEEDQLTLRYLWASAVITGFNDPSRDNRLAFFADLQDSLAGHPVIDLPNSTIMPEISASRAERELSKLKTVDFFNAVFSETTEANKDPEDVVDLLEAVLKPGEVIPYNEEEDRMLKEIGHFLDGSSAMFKLHLWEKLKSAYQATGHKSRILSCTLKCIQILMKELTCRNYMESSQDHRNFVLLRSLRLIDTMILDTLGAIQADRTAVDELTNDEALKALDSLLKLLRLCHCFSLWEASALRSEAKASDSHSYRLVQVKFRELLVRSWVTTYYVYAGLLKRGLGTDGGDGLSEKEQQVRLMGLLRDLHEELGPRHYCKLANHIFLKLMYDELVRFDSRDFESDFLQCIRCRFDLTICSDQWNFDDHKTDPEKLTREVGMQLLDFVLPMAAQKKHNQLVKSGIQNALDKVVEIVGVPKRSLNGRLFHNDAVIHQYWKSSINPLRLFESLKGGVSISTVEVHGEYKEIASKGLYFLQGKLAMHPLKTSKRQVPLKQEDMRTALEYFKHDLVCNPDNWKTWYRIAQMNEMLMEEEITWTADSVNTERAKLVELERASILSYMMAASCAVQHANRSPDILRDVAEMYTDFGYRVYSASRPPMARESFWVDGFEKRYSGHRGEGMYIGRPHPELTAEMAWRMALQLFQSSIEQGGDGNWKNYYMMGKCMNKLYNMQAKFSGDQFTCEQVLEKYVDAVTRCPEKINGEYIFEPHHRLISCAIKLVLGPFKTDPDFVPPPPALSPERACEVLDASHFTKRIPHATDKESFVKFCIEALRKMKSLDKSKWHHRMTNRIAHMLEQHCHDIPAAKAEIATLFSTKSAQLNIWKPDNERRGRHYYYASQYVVFYARLLDLTQDRATLEQLSKRVRKNSNGLFRHPDVWCFVFQAYMRTLRKSGNIPLCHDEEVFKTVSMEEFTLYSSRLDTWCASPVNKSPTLDLLREVFELRKLNAALVKTAAIEDLLIDVYARLYEEVVPELRKQDEQKKVDQANPMNLKNLMFDSPPVEKEKPPVTSEEGQPGAKKNVKVSRRELISKASGICKELAVPAQQQTATSGLSVKPGNAGTAGTILLPHGSSASPRVQPMVVVEASRPRTPDDRMQVDQEEDEETEEDDESASTKMVIDG